jgi:uncharacterized protein (TIGR03067 family)
MNSTCPEAGSWQDLLQGNVTDKRQAALTAHLDECASCQQALEGLVASRDSWSGTAKQLHDEPLDPTGKLGDVVARLKAPTTGTETLAEGAAGAEADLSFLQPSARAGHLGRLKHYEFLEILGKGGFGTVFKAHDESLDRMVAIKVLAPHFATNGKARARFIREAKAAAAVSHDHVVGIHEVADKEPVPFLVMQLISGRTLQDRLDQTGPLELKEILRIGMQTAEGLAAAHKQGLVHRDIKPANILLENGVERVKLTDFGLARAIDDASVTQSGVIAGTPMFMAPEQAAGEPVDHRADLFSLGSVLYAMCTGHPPFRASGTMAVLKRVIDDSPRPIREINADIPDWLCDIVAKLHAKKPAERFETAKDVAELLGRHLAHEQQPSQVSMPARVRQPLTVARSSSPPLSRMLPLPLLLMASPLFVEILKHLLAPRYGTLPFVYSFPLFGLSLLGILAGFTLLLARLAGRLADQELVDGSSPPPRTPSLVLPLLLIGVPLVVEILLHLFAPKEGVFSDVFSFPLFLLAAATVGTGCGTLAACVARRQAAARFSGKLPPHRPRRWAAGLALALGVAWLLGWFGPAASRYLQNRGELAFTADGPGLEHIDVLRDGQKFTDFDPRFNSTLELPPGRYRLQPTQQAADRAVYCWQLTTWGMFDWGVFDNVEAVQGGNSCEFELGRGRGVSVRALLHDAMAGLSEDEKLLQGVWVPVSGVFSGKPLAEEEFKTGRLTFNGRSVNFSMKGISGDTSFVLDSTRNPKTMSFAKSPAKNEQLDINKQADLKRLIDAANGKFTNANVKLSNSIYTVDADTLTLCCVPDDGPFPATFESPAGSSIALYVFKREGTHRPSSPLEGRWTIVREESSGTDLSTDMTGKWWEFKGAMRFHKFDRKDDPAKCEYRIDATQTPPHIDLVSSGKVLNHGIYELKGDELTVCFSMPPEPRPRTFVTRRNTSLYITVLRRERISRPDEEQLQGTWTPIKGTWFKAPFSPEELKGGRMIFDGKDLRLIIPKDLLMQGTFKLDSTKKPKELTFVIADTDVSTRRTDGIYELNGDTLRICFGYGPRPKDFVDAQSILNFVFKREAPAADKDGFVQLFNGKDLTGWKTHPDQPGEWRVEDGVLIGADKVSHLFTERGDFANFHLRVEAMINPKGDSGVFFRSGFNFNPDNPQKVNPLGYEAQILGSNDDDMNTGTLFWVTPIVKVKDSPTEADKWFTLEVVAEGRRLLTRVNGKTTAYWVDNEEGRPTKGHIALQVFHSFTVVKFRKIEIKELPTSKTANAKATDTE